MRKTPSKVKLLPYWLLLAFINLPQVALAEVVKYTDENNSVIFVDSIEKVPEKYRDKVEQISAPKISKVTAATYQAPSAKKREEVISRKSGAKIEIFVASWCSYCRALESFLIEKKIRYAKFDIENDKEGREQYDAMGRGGIPISRIGTKVIRGYRPEEVLAALKSRS